MKNLRLKEGTLGRNKGHPDFMRVQKGEENVFVVTAGQRSGDVHTELSKYDHYSDWHIFIKAKDETVIQNLVSLETELHRIANVTSRIRHVGFRQIVDAYERSYGRPEILFEL